MKFKVGDIVRVSNDKGREGIVYDIQLSRMRKDDLVVSVRFEFITGYFYSSNLELAGTYGKYHMIAREICGGAE